MQPRKPLVFFAWAGLACSNLSGPLSFEKLIDDQVADKKLQARGKLSSDRRRCLAEREKKMQELVNSTPQAAKETSAFHRSLGRYYLLLDNQTEAWAQFSVAHQKDPADPQPSYYLAKLARSENRSELERSYLEAALQSVGRDAAERSFQRDMAQRYVEILSGPDALKFIEGFWAQIALEEPVRAEAALKIALAQKNIPLLEHWILAYQVFVDNQKLNSSALPYYRGQLALLKNLPQEARKEFSLYLKQNQRDPMFEQEALKTALQIAFDTGNEGEIRRLVDLRRKQGFLNPELLTLLEGAIFRGAIKGKLLDAKRPVQDLDALILLLPKSPRLQLRMIELLRGSLPFKPEASFRESVLRDRKIKAHLDLLSVLAPEWIDGFYQNALWAYEQKQFSDAWSFIQVALDHLRRKETFSGQATGNDLYALAIKIAQASGQKEAVEKLSAEAQSLSKRSP